MRRDTHGFPSLRSVEQFLAILVARRGQRIIVVDAALPDIPFKDAVLLAGIEQAEEMHPVFGDSLKALEGKNPSILGRLDQPRRFLDPIMVGHADHFDALFLAGSDDSGVVVRLGLERGLLIMPAEIRERVHL